MNPSEKSVSQASVSGLSQSHDNNANGKAKLHLLDLVFPVFDQTMLKCKFPAWFNSITALYMSIQMLVIAIWPFSDPITRLSGKWKSVYKVFFKCIYFADPLNLESDHLIEVLVLTGICFTALNWLTFVVGYDMIYLKTPVPFLYMCAIFLDTCLPLVNVPAVYCAAHGIAALQYNYNKKLVIQTALGFFCWLSSSLFIYISLVLKTRQIILIKLTFQMFDGIPFLIWFMSSTTLLVLSSVLRYFANWYFVALAIVHILLTCMMSYRLWFIPFYTLNRNKFFFAAACTGIAMDIYTIVMFFAQTTFNYTIIVFFIVGVIAYITSHFIFKFKINKIKDELTHKPENTDLTEYFDSLKFKRHPLKTMSYLVVGLAECCDYLADGSILDYLVNHGEGESIWCQTLQVLTFFPSDSTKLNAIFKKIRTLRNLHYNDRYLVYAVKKVQSQRLVSGSKDSLEIYGKLKLMNDQAKSNVKVFFDKTVCHSRYLTAINNYNEHVRRNFEYTLVNNPNNLRIIGEYVDFLIEATGDYDKALIQKIKHGMIQDGKNFNVDQSFRSLVAYFPKYLKNRIFDTKGKRILSKNQDESKQSSNDSSSRGSVNFNEIETEEFVESSIIRESRVRLAFYRSIKDMRPKHVQVILQISLLTLIIGLAFFIGFYMEVKSLLSWRRNGTNDIANLAYSVFYSHYTHHFTLIEWAIRSGKFDNDWSKLGDLDADETLKNKNLVPDNMSYPMLMYYVLSQSRNYLNTFTQSIAELGKGDNNLNAARHFLEELAHLQVCAGGKIVANYTATLNDLLVFLPFDYNWIGGDFVLGQSKANIFEDDFFCQALGNMFTTSDQAHIVFEELLNYQTKQTEQTSKTIMYFMIVGALLLFFIIFIPTILVCQFYIAMVNSALKMLLRLPQPTRESAKAPVMVENLNSTESQMLQASIAEKPNFLVMVHISIFIVLIVLYVMLGLTAMDTNKNASKFVNWFYLSAKRMVTANEIGSNALEMIVLGDGRTQNNIISFADIHNRTEFMLKKLEETERTIYNGDSDTERMIGFDDTLDNLMIGETCHLEHNPDSVHEIYACNSLKNQMNFFGDVVTGVLRRYQIYNGSLNHEYAINLIHILEEHIFPNIVKTSEYIADLSKSSFDKQMITCLVYMILGIVLCIFYAAICLSYSKAMMTSWRVLMSLFQRLPPSTIVNNREILDFFTRNHKHKNDEIMSVSKSIVYKVSECIIITNENTSVQIVNESFTENTGMTPDQMLGQNIGNFMNPEDKERIENQIHLMVSGQVSAVWTDHIRIYNSMNKLLQFSLTMIGMKDKESSSKIESVVFILTNEEEELKKAKDAEIAKAKSEKLLYQILPKDIVIKLNRGETDISFVIPRCSIFFIDIVKFSAYASLLTPSEIMANLSLVFATFDKIMADYESITKIKLIGDVYMAAAGLFQDPEDTSPKHAEDACKACIAVQKSMEEINMKLSASLEVRIGINSGGPLIGGVLGSDKPTFDIIGDPINVAARLQSTDIPGKVQISENTRTLIQGLDFHIEERGKVYLKGKGDMMTYFVNEARNRLDMGLSSEVLESIGNRSIELNLKTK